MRPDARAHPEPIELLAYLDGELSWRRRRSVGAHLASCTECALDVASQRELLSQAAQLRAPSEPSADLWPGIAGRLAPRAPARPAGWPSWPAGAWPRLAAAGALAVALVLAAVLWPGEPGTTTPRTEIPAAPPAAMLETEPPPGAAGASAAAPATTAAEQEYLETVAALERKARARLTFDPRVAEVLDENLASLNAAIANYREALLEEPGDERLRRRLVEAREHKIEVLEHALSLSSLETN